MAATSFFQSRLNLMDSGVSKSNYCVMLSLMRISSAREYVLTCSESPLKDEYVEPLYLDPAIRTKISMN